MADLEGLAQRIEIDPFYCHKGIAEGEAAKALCRGYLLLAGRRAQP